MGQSISVSVLRRILQQYANVPAKETILIGDELDEIREDIVTITNSEIKNLAAAPKELVAAQGAGKIVILRDLMLKLNYGGTNVFTVGAGDDLLARYVDGAGLAASASIETTGWLDQAVNQYARYQGIDIATGALAQLANVALVLDNIASEVAGNAANDNTITATVRYSVIDA